MALTLDGQSLFDGQQLEIEPGSFRRDSIEKAVPGLDGLRAKSRSQMNDRIGTISAYMDGDTHTLVTNSGEKFDNLRMDVFKVNKERADGGGIVVDYEIAYTQLV
jgi:hypothetical protein